LAQPRFAVAIVLLAAMAGADDKEAAHKKAVEADVQAGQEYSKEVEKTIKFSKDAKAQERLERVGETIAQIARTTKAEVSYGDKRLNPFPCSRTRT
jgi:hypothetical protein